MNIELCIKACCAVDELLEADEDKLPDIVNQMDDEVLKFAFLDYFLKIAREYYYEK